jgi:two-component system, LytTR family, response regulator
LDLVKTFDNAIEAISLLKTEIIDLVFLDIQMEECSGIQFLEALVHKPEIIITTAYDQYAIKGFEHNVTDYLLKPYTFERYNQAVERVFEKLKKDKAVKNHLFVKTDYRHVRVNFDEILYIEGMREYLAIVTPSKKILTLQTFKTIEEQLPTEDFIRVHKSYIVAMNKIESIDRSGIKIKDKVIPVSLTYKEDFFHKTGLT